MAGSSAEGWRLSTTSTFKGEDIPVYRRPAHKVISNLLNCHFRSKTSYKAIPNPLQETSGQMAVHQQSNLQVAESFFFFLSNVYFLKMYIIHAQLQNFGEIHKSMEKEINIT